MWKQVEVVDDTFLPDIVRLTTEYYGSQNDISRKKYLQHEYFCNPAGRVILQIAYDEDEGAVVGQVAAVPIIIKIKDKEYKCLMVGNVLTSDACRRQGVFKTLGSGVYDKAVKESYDLAFAMPNQYSFPGFIKYHGFAEMGRVPLYVRPLVPSQMVKSYLHSKLLARCAGLFDGLYKIKIPEECSLIDFKDGLERYADEFWNIIKDSYQIMVRRDYAYLKWRFADIPFRHYSGYYALEDRRPVAFVLGRNMEVSGLKCAMIADILFVEGYEYQAITALKKLLSNLMNDGAEMAGCMVPCFSKERKLLKKLGFFKCPRFLEPQPFRLVSRKLNQIDEDIKIADDLNNWFFTMGNYDVV